MAGGGKAGMYWQHSTFDHLLLVGMSRYANHIQMTLIIGKDSGKAKAKSVTRSQRSGLQFPVGRIHRHLKSRTTSHGRIGATAAVYRYDTTTGTAMQLNG